MCIKSTLCTLDVSKTGAKMGENDVIHIRYKCDTTVVTSRYKYDTMLIFVSVPVQGKVPSGTENRTYPIV